MDHSIGRGVEDYLIAVLAVTIAAIATALLWPLSEAAPLALFYGAVAVAARRGGVGPRLAAMLGSALFGVYFFLPPYGSFQLGPKSASAIVVFLGVSALIGWLAGPRRAAAGAAPARTPWLEHFVEAIGEGAAIIDAQGRIVHLNPVAEGLTGWSLEEARGRPTAEVLRIVDERTRRPRDPSAEVLAAGEEGSTPPVESILISRSGAEIPIADAVAPMWEGAEKLAGVVMIVRDLTQRARVRESPRRTEELNRKIVDNSDVCIKLLDRDGRLLMINDYGARLLEMDEPAAWIGRDLGETWPLESREKLREASRSAATGQRARFEAFAPTAKGTPKWWDVSIAPIVDAAGKLEKFLCIGRDVTERKRAEDALRVGEERYRALFNSVEEGFCVDEVLFDDEGRLIDVRVLEANPVFEALTGQRDVAGRTLRELGHGEETYWLAVKARVALTGEPVRFSTLQPSFGDRWYEARIFRVGGDESRKVAVLFRNITETVLADRERARLARELEGQRSELARLIENAPAFIAVLRGPDHVIEFANAQCYGLAGQRDAVGLPVSEAAPELQGQGYLELLDQVYRTGEPFVGQAMAVNLDREGSGDLTKRFINFVYQAMRDANGAITGVFVHGVDVTEMVEAIEAVRESEIRFRQMAEAMPLAVWTTDPKGVSGLRNQKFLEYFGIREEDVVKKRWRDAVHPDDLESLNNAWAQSLRDGTPYEQEIRLKRASDGEYRWQLVHALPIRDEQGEIVRWIGANSDIDDYKRLSEALKQADQRKDEFLATLAHELRNPLSPIRTGLQILEMKPKEDVVASTVEMMSRQVGHMTTLIDDLMDLARVGSGKINLRKERVELRSIVETALERIRPAIQERRHELTVKLAAEPIHLEADPTRIGQVISNLLTNAAKYTEPGGQIEISAGREGQEAVIRVKDSGVGLEHDMLEKVFEMFSQVGSSIKDSQGGLGIGLTVVKRLVELHDGRIEAKSGGLGLGSEFVVHLPIVAAGPERGSKPELVRDEGGAARLRVLVVDDNRDSAESLAKIVAMSGHQVRVAYNGEDALVAAESDPPDLVLLDIGLPGINGYEVAERIRRDPRLREAKLVAVTGWGQSEDRRRSREAGFDLHLVKPVDLGVLQALLESGVEALKRQIAGPGAPPSSNGADARSRPIPDEWGA